jgi:hypothetical protein
MKACNRMALLNSGTKCISQGPEYLPVAFPGSVLHNQSHRAVVVIQDRYFNTRKLSSVTNRGEGTVLVAAPLLETNFTTRWITVTRGYLVTSFISRTLFKTAKILAKRLIWVTRLSLWVESLKTLDYLKLLYENLLQFIFVDLCIRFNLNGWDQDDILLQLIMFKVEFEMPEGDSRKILETRGLGASNPLRVVLTTPFCYHIKQIKSKEELTQSKCSQYHFPSINQTRRQRII